MTDETNATGETKGTDETKGTNVTNYNINLFDLIGNFDNVSRIAALRGIANSTMAQCIGAIRQDIRNRKLKERQNVADAGKSEVDQRNEQEEADRSPHENREAVTGFKAPLEPLALASMLHAVHEWATSELYTLSTSVFDEPMSVKGMVAYMIDNAKNVSPVLVSELAKAAGCKEDEILKFHEINAQQDQKQLIEAAPEIILTFNGFGSNGHLSALDDIPVITYHQLGIKLADTLKKAKGNVLTRALRSRRLDNIGDIALLEAAMKETSCWIANFERKHREEIRDAIENGRNIRTLDDAA